LLAVGHVHLRIATVTALNEPFKAEVDQGGMVDNELAGYYLVGIVRGGASAGAKQA